MTRNIAQVADAKKVERVLYSGIFLSQLAPKKNILINSENWFYWIDVTYKLKPFIMFLFSMQDIFLDSGATLLPWKI